MQSLKNNIVTAVNMVNIAKAQFAETIKDKQIPLEERWKLFEETPLYIKGFEPWVERFIFSGEQIAFYDDFDVEKGSTVDLHDIVQTLTEQLSHDGHYNPIELTEANILDLDALKEDILQRNIGSFVYDW